MVHELLSLWRRASGSQWAHHERQTAVFVSFLWAVSARRFYRSRDLSRTQSRDFARLSRAHFVARTDAHFWCLALDGERLDSKKVSQLPPVESTLLPAEDEDVLELDELWSFVLRRKNKRWIWLALCRRTRQIVAFAVGARDEATCRLLWQRVPQAYRNSLLYSDFWEAYQKVLPSDQHEAVDKKSGQTNHVERWNNTLRQRLGRFVRKSLSFSKCDFMHETCLRLFVHEYNLSKLST